MFLIFWGWLVILTFRVGDDEVFSLCMGMVGTHFRKRIVPLMSSPRMWGWLSDGWVGLAQLAVFPAHVGMVGFQG